MDPILSTYVPICEISTLKTSLDLNQLIIAFQFSCKGFSFHLLLLPIVDFSEKRLQYIAIYLNGITVHQFSITFSLAQM